MERAFLNNEVLLNYVTRVRLAAAEAADAQKSVDDLSAALVAARNLLARCCDAQIATAREMNWYCVTGRQELYCMNCDTNYGYEPMTGGVAPVCPTCQGEADTAAAMLRRAAENGSPV